MSLALKSECEYCALCNDTGEMKSFVPCFRLGLLAGYYFSFFRFRVQSSKRNFFRLKYLEINLILCSCNRIWVQFRFGGAEIERIPEYE